MKQNQPTHNVFDLISPHFHDMFLDMCGFYHDEYWMDGGRGSTKSSFASLAIIHGLMSDTTGEANAVVYRKVANTLRDSVFAQLKWAIYALGVERYFHWSVSPMEIVYLPRKQRILFRGADDPQKSKGLKLDHGYFAYLWFEELSEFYGMDDVRTIKASVIRGGGRTVTLYTYNPPMSAMNWVNGEALTRRKGRLRNHSTYLDVPKAWLGDSFFADAEALKDSNELAYRHMYLGEVTGTGGRVFTNLSLRRMTDSELSNPAYNGLDFGFACDPDAFVRCRYDRKRRALYITGERIGTGLSTGRLYEAVYPLCGREVVTCDSADPRSISDLRSRGLQAIAAKKGPDSVEHGVKWLQTLSEIVIDPDVCQEAAKEFQMYEYDRDKEGHFIPRYPDKNNHTIDAVRYAMESVSALRTAKIRM